MPESKKSSDKTQKTLPVEKLRVLYSGNQNPSERYCRGVRRGVPPQDPSLKPASEVVPPVIVLSGRSVVLGRPPQPKSQPPHAHEKCRK